MENILVSWIFSRHKLVVVSAGITEAVVEGFIQKYCLKLISHQNLF